VPGGAKPFMTCPSRRVGALASQSSYQLPASMKSLTARFWLRRAVPAPLHQKSIVLLSPSLSSHQFTRDPDLPPGVALVQL